VKQRNYRPVLITLAMAMFVAPLQPSFGGVISTQQYLVANDRDAALARVNTVLARTEVRARLEQLGVDPVAAQERIAALTDEELQLLATDLENLPAGGSLLAVVGIVAIVLLVLELLDVTDLFKKI
jgi:hypothetical protein